MRVSVQSFIPWLAHLNGEYEVPDGATATDFLQQLGLQWDRDALVAINDRIVKENDRLSTGDRIILMIPLTGG